MITASGVHPKPAKVEGRKLSATAKSAEVLILPCAAQIAVGQCPCRIIQLADWRLAPYSPTIHRPHKPGSRTRKTERLGRNLNN